MEEKKLINLANYVFKNLHIIYRAKIKHRILIIRKKIKKVLNYTPYPIDTIECSCHCGNRILLSKVGICDDARVEEYKKYTKALGSNRYIYLNH